jgi:hypothetical protein
MGLIRMSYEPELRGVSVSAIGVKLSEAVGGIGPRA